MIIKHLKLSAVFLFIFLLIEVGALVYLNNDYLMDHSDFQIESLSNDADSTAANITVTLPDKYENLQYSNDAAYIAYKKDDDICVTNFKDGSTQSISPEKNADISCYKFVQNRSRLVIAEKNSTDNCVKLYYYDISNKSKEEIYNSVNNKSIEISLNNKTEDVSDLQLSSATNLIYVKLTYSGKSRLYCLNIMAQASSAKLPTTNIGTVNLLYGDDVLYYENQDKNCIYKKGQTTALKIGGKTDYSIVGSDSNSKLYVAEEKNDKISTIYYGDAKNGWEKITLDESVSLKDVTVSFNSNVYVNDETKKELKNVTSGKSLTYNGSVVGITDGKVLILNNHELSTQTL